MYAYIHIHRIIHNIHIDTRIYAPVIFSNPLLFIHSDPASACRRHAIIRYKDYLRRLEMQRQERVRGKIKALRTLLFKIFDYRKFFKNTTVPIKVSLRVSV